MIEIDARFVQKGYTVPFDCLVVFYFPILHALKKVKVSSSSYLSQQEYLLGMISRVEYTTMLMYRLGHSSVPKLQCLLTEQCSNETLRCPICQFQLEEEIIR